MQEAVNFFFKIQIANILGLQVVFDILFSVYSVKAAKYSQRQHINKLADGVNKHGYVHRIICSSRHPAQSHSLPSPALISKYIFHHEYELEIVKLLHVHSKIEQTRKYIVDESQVSHSLKKQHEYGLKRYLCAHICTHSHIYFQLCPPEKP